MKINRRSIRNIRVVIGLVVALLGTIGIVNVDKINTLFSGNFSSIGELAQSTNLTNTQMQPGNRTEVTLEKVVDGDTAWFNEGNETIKVRFLYVDTPESTNTVEPFGKEASEFTKNTLTNATKIELETNPDGDAQDKYGRILAWVFVDGELLQLKLVESGLVEDFYDYGYNYTYKDQLIAAQEVAKANHVGMYK